MNEMFVSKPSQVITKTVQFTEYSLYLHGEIGEPDNFMEHFAVYKSAGEGDVVRLYVNSLGGSLATGMEYVRHMRECEAKIIAVLGVEVASMASAIALEADEIEIDELSTLLIHSISYGAGGTESSVYSQAVFNNKLNERWVRETYGGFLPEDKILRVLDGVDILLDADQIAEYWSEMKRKRDKEHLCDCEHCLEEVSGGEEYTQMEILSGEITNKRTVNGNVRLSVDITPEVYDRIDGNLLNICVEMSEGGGNESS